MNIKSLILGSAAALVAGGAAQAADLPVAEPVDYVKVCDAYGAGYFFIPGTDTCLKIGGKVLFGIQSNGFQQDATRATDLIDMYTETTLKVTAREETELGTLTAHAEFDDANTTGAASTSMGIDKAYITLGGFYAGITDSLIDFNAGYGYDDFGFDHGDLNAIGYKADMGNGVTAAIALEEFAGNIGVGVSAPAVAASLSVAQGWGSVAVGASVFQVRYANPNFSTDFGYSVGGKAVFNIAEGLKFGVAGGYTLGGGLPLSGAGTSGATIANIAGTLNSGWSTSAGLEYAFADNFTVYLDAGYEVFNDRAATNEDYKAWGASLKAKYVPVKNLSISGKVGYRKVDYSNAFLAANPLTKDWDDVAAKLEIERSF